MVRVKGKDSLPFTLTVKTRIDFDSKILAPYIDCVDASVPLVQREALFRYITVYTVLKFTGVHDLT